MTPAGQFTVPATHPSLPGHFPSHPVVPGVVLLDEVAALLAQAHPSWRLLALPRVKFTHPVRPGDEVAVLAGAPDGGRIAFQCHANGQGVMAGTAAFGPA